MASTTTNSYFSNVALDACGPDRDYSRFRRYLKPCIPDEDDKKCSICRAAFGTTNADTGLSDLPLQVYGVPGCHHVFGKECLKQVFRSRGPGFNLCPLCRTPWFKVSCRTSRRPLAETPAQMSSKEIEDKMQVARLCHTDRVSASELVRSCNYDVDPDIKLMRFAQLFEYTQYVQDCERIYRSPRIKTMVSKLRSNPPTQALDDRHFWYSFEESNGSLMQKSSGHDSLVESPNPDPFTFQHYHLISNKDLFKVVVHAMSYWKAERMRIMLREEDHVRAFLMATKTTDVILEGFMARWTCIFGSKYVDFARLMAAIFLPMEAMMKRCREFKHAGRV